MTNIAKNRKFERKKVRKKANFWSKNYNFAWMNVTICKQEQRNNHRFENLKY